ncbi:hypothetical protein GGS20DRAFT_60770 [Poronia punctata]|nr:hypothetical protein GGS20DRAFT_60770 [Poronia punctata]
MTKDSKIIIQTQPPEQRNVIADIYLKGFAAVASFAKHVLSAIKTLLNSIRDFLKGIWEKVQQVWAQVKAAAASAIEFLGHIFHPDSYFFQSAKGSSLVQSVPNTVKGSSLVQSVPNTGTKTDTKTDNYGHFEFRDGILIIVP